MMQYKIGEKIKFLNHVITRPLTDSLSFEIISVYRLHFELKYAIIP